MDFIPVAIAYIFGVYVSDYMETALFAVALTFCLLVLYLIRRLIKKPISFTPVLLAIIAAFGVCNTFMAKSFENSPIHDYYGTYSDITGVVCDMPYQNGDITRYIVYSNYITFKGVTTPVKQKFLVNSNELFKCGDKVVVHGRISELRQKNGKFDMNPTKYYGSRGIQARVNAMSMIKTDVPVRCYSPAYYANLIRTKIADNIYRYYSGDYANVLVAVMTGNKHNFSPEYDRILHRTGMKHLYYPVFAHIMLMSSMVALFSNIVKKRNRDFALCALLLIYALFNSSNPVALKSAAVIALATVCNIIFGTFSRSNMTALVLLIIGILNPLMLFDSGLIFSVSAMIILNCFLSVNPFRNRIVSLFWRYFLLMGINIPIMAYFFHQVYPYSFWASLIFIPANVMVLLLSPLFYINCLFGTPNPIGYPIRTFGMIMLKLPYLVDKLPLKTLVVGAPSIAFIIAWYSAVAVVYFRRKKKPTKVHICTAVSAALFLSCAVSEIRDINKIQVHVINVGQGDAIMIRQPYSCNILIDGGGSPTYSDYNIGEHVFLPYLYGEGVNLVHAAFVSHYHKDHVEGIIAALETMPVYHLFMPDVMPDNEFRIKLEEAAAKNNTAVHYIAEDTNLRVGNININITVPHEYTRISKNENDTSLLIEARYGKFNALFTGDMSSFAERNLLMYGNVPQADLLKIAHHGSASSSSEDMIEHVDPKFVSIGVGEDNGYNLPSKEVLKRLEGRTVFRTDLNGDIVIYAAKDGEVRVQTYQ